MSKDLVPLYSALDSIFNNSIFDDFFNFHQTTFSTFLDKFKFPDFRSSVSYPKANCYLTEDAIHLEIAVTGFAKEDIEIKREGNDITIKAKKENDECEERGYVFRDLALRDFIVTYKLSNKFDYNKIDTRLENGILYISIPIKEEEKAEIQKIEIK